MNAPQRLATCDDEVARLFTALEEDAPPRDAEAALIARLDAIDASAPPAGPRWSSLRTWAIAGGLFVTGLVAVIVAVRQGPKTDDGMHVRAPAVTPSSSAAAPPLGSSRESGRLDLPPATILSVAVEDLPAAPSPRTAPTPSSSAGSAEAKDSFREQLAILEGARHALSQGRPDECLATLRGYDAKYPAGLFTTEARVVRIEALIAAGESERAYALARGLLSSDPHGPYGDRLRSLLPKTDGLKR